MWLPWLALITFVAGFYLFPFGEAQVLTFSALAVLGLVVAIREQRLKKRGLSPFGYFLLGGLLIWLALSLLMPSEAEPGWWPIVRGFLNIVLMGLFLAVTQQTARLGNWARTTLLQSVVVAAVFSSIVSIIHSRSFVSLVDGRFRNLLVYTDGLNPVLSGLSCGFAAIISLGIARKQESTAGFFFWWVPAMLLVVVAYFSHSRCAMIGLAAGMAVLFFSTSSWRRLAMLAPLIAGAVQFALGAPTNEYGTPLEQLVQRGDSGRSAIYSAIWCRMQDPFFFVFGHGLLAPEALPEGEAGVMAFHAHSIYVATFFHGGLPGLALLLIVLFIGLRNAWRWMRHRDDPLWLALLCFGMTGLLFDGSMPLRILTITRIEPIILLFPLAMAVELARQLPKAAHQVAPSLSAKQSRLTLA